MKMIFKIAKTELQSLFYSPGGLVDTGYFYFSGRYDRFRFV